MPFIAAIFETESGDYRQKINVAGEQRLSFGIGVSLCKYAGSFRVLSFGRTICSDFCFFTGRFFHKIRHFAGFLFIYREAILAGYGTAFRNDIIKYH